ncbi:hypothetical protein [Nitratidesulfovibrio vulgaris]|jgi:hypothetical protein|uniref:Uncharacterized protein n=1 Tax=Nitratidesulfovibrio vulgaris (strain DP4) TaxID=391774 RepID=A0A0H3A950_NITV4|nr:hypothetical protein [Nitratidesulfovibrio vulgaris]GEB80595.1 hypothetical protein DDE01_20100 [Desulfovibrio desulfuricans]HBW16651.1 hypothetical protein [Desulfovibrio sp.]ABM28017.1 conserved hypothetical protein [Nitratidesulfovibrio vulgaris DP4]ADP87236.1 hypothetical protein Deval_2092 [Nitratidesulfovibrio vulgaris RCH1]WCB45783.1 hypothetical protein PH214_12090 [Nitratidesulfovibrio vulgaris]
MEYTERDLPLSLNEAEVVVLSDGTQVRFEESGGARDVFINDEWSARAQLFPGAEYLLETPSGNYLLTAGESTLEVKRA